MGIGDDLAAKVGLAEYTILDAAEGLRSDFVDDAGDLITDEERHDRLALTDDPRVQEFIKDVYSLAKGGLSPDEVEELTDKYRDDGLTSDHLRGWNGAWIAEHKDGISGLDGLWISEAEQQRIITTVAQLGRYGERGEADVAKKLVSAAKAGDPKTRELAAKALAVMYLGTPERGDYYYEVPNGEFTDIKHISKDVEAVWKDASFDPHVRLILMDAWVKSGQYGDTFAKANSDLMSCGNPAVEVAAVELMGKAHALWRKDAVDYLAMRMIQKDAEKPLPGSDKTDEPGYSSMRQACMVAMANVGGWWKLLEVAQNPSTFFENDQYEGRAEAIASLGVFMDEHPFRYIETREGVTKPLYDQNKIVDALVGFCSDDNRQVQLAAIQSLGEADGSIKALKVLASIVGHEDPEYVLTALAAISEAAIHLGDDAATQQAKMEAVRAITRMVRSLPGRQGNDWIAVRKNAESVLRRLT